MLSKERPYLSAAASNLRVLSEEEKIQMQCEARERYFMDMNSARSEGEEKGLKRGLKQGIKQGIKQGTDLVNRLNQLLLDDNRPEDLKRSIIDPDFQKKLLEEYGLK